MNTDPFGNIGGGNNPHNNPHHEAERDESRDESTLGACWNQAESRRRFLKRTGAASVATALAWHGMRVEVYGQGSTAIHYADEKSYSSTSAYVYDNKTEAAAAGNALRQSLASDPQGTYDSIAAQPTALYRVIANPVDVNPNTYSTYNGSVMTQKHPTTGKWAYVVSLDVKRVFKKDGP